MKKKANKKAKAQAKPQAKAKAKAKPKTSGETGSNLPLSPFLKAFRTRVIAPNRKSLWPPATMSKPDEAVADLKKAVDMLLQVVLAPAPAPAPGGPGSAQQHVSDLLGAPVPWPRPDNSDIPEKWQADNNLKLMFRLYEVAWAVNFMLRAYARSGGGGGGQSNWPPPPPP